MRPEITVTGADVKTDITALKNLKAEIGFLYTKNPDGRNRYPERKWIEEVAPQIEFAALHVCGNKARHELLYGELTDLLTPFSRVQVNGQLALREVETICKSYPHISFITQHTELNEYLLTVEAPNHSVLVDSSGGRGLSPTSWYRPNTSKSVGFAGGLGPGNLKEQLDLISAVAKIPSWIDMEGKLRVDDWFSIEKAQEAISIFEEYARSQNHYK